MRLGFSLALLVSFSAASPIPSNKPETYPSWWFERDVILRNDPTREPTTWPGDYPLSDDYAALNIGQLKTIASMAYDELRSRLPDAVWNTETNSSSARLTSLIQAWREQQGSRDDYAVANLGQLKHVASHFYDFLRECGYVAGPNARPPGWSSGEYPWTASLAPADDFAAANLGQLKAVFAFDLSAPPGQIPEWWQRFYFDGQTGIDPTADADGDGISNFEEFQENLNPMHVDSDGDGLSDLLEIVSGGNILLRDRRLPNIPELLLYIK